MNLADDEITDGGFESPALAANTYQVAPVGTPWQFAGSAGISNGDNSLTAGNTTAPQGYQVGFLQNTGSMSYSVYLDAETYDLAFMAVQRVDHQSANQQIQVLVDGTQVALITPINTTVTSTSSSTPTYTAFETLTFTVAAGVHTITFAGMTNPSSGTSTAFIDDVTLTTLQNSFSDGGFESPVLAADNYQVAPAGSAWQFSGLAGVTANYSGFNQVTNGSLNAPDGAQAAFIKDGANISQSVYLDAGTYNISFLATQRIKYQTQNQQIEVLLDGVPLLEPLITPAVAETPTSTATDTVYTYTPYQTTNFTVAAGEHTIEFLGMAPSTADSTAFVDDMMINQGCAVSDGSFEEPAVARTTTWRPPAARPGRSPDRPA